MRDEVGRETDNTSMLILGLDTSTRKGSLALVRGDSVTAEASGDSARTHSERLPGDIQTLVAGAGLTLSDIDRFAVTVGPGPFTGLRVGIATVQALALVHNRSVVPVSTLDAVARNRYDATAGIERILVWMDAQRGEVFAGLYECTGAVACLKGPRVGTPSDILSGWAEQLSARGICVTGNAVTTNRSDLEVQLGTDVIYEPEVPPLAPTIARMAAGSMCVAVAPHAVQPLYVRRPDAVLARERSLATPARSTK